MITLLTALVGLALLTGGDEDVVRRNHVRFGGESVVGGTCSDVMAGIAEPGLATIHFQYQVSDGHRTAPGRYTGRIVFTLTEVQITMPKSILWARMTGRDREHAEALRRAIYHHEVGHVRIAEAVRDELNALDAVVEPDPFAFRAAADARGREGFERFKREEREYDALTEHGRKQHLAPGVLAGPDTTLFCSG